MNLIGFLLIMMLLPIGLEPQKPSDTVGDPPSTVKHRKKNTKNPNRKPRDIIQGKNFERELIGYEIGHLTKKRESISFCNSLAEEILTHISSGQEIEKIVITGYADSITNKGIKYDLKLLPLSCRREIGHGAIDNPKLAYLRGCLVQHSLEGILKPNYPVNINWEKTGIDYHKEEEQGDQYRKVAVQVFFR